MRRVIAIAVLSLACRGRDQVADRPTLACFAPESLRVRPIAFGALTQDSESDLWLGFEVRFGIDPGGVLFAAIRHARGELPPVRRVDSLIYNAAKDSLWFRYNAGGATSYVYQLRPDCTRLTGAARLRITASNPTGTLRQDTLPRILNPLPDKR